jgi:hypothetical protein
MVCRQASASPATPYLSLVVSRGKRFESALRLYLHRDFQEKRDKLRREVILTHPLLTLLASVAPCPGDEVESIFTGYPQRGICFVRTRSRTAVLQCA